MKTYEERLIAGLLKLGYTPISSKSSKYKTFKVPGKENLFVFVGSRGALRLGRCSTKSYSIGDPASQSTKYKQLLELGTELL